MKPYFFLLLSILMTFLACRKDTPPSPPNTPNNTIDTTNTTDSLSLLIRSEIGDFIPFGIGSTWNYIVQRYDTINGIPHYTLDTIYYNCQGQAVIGNYVYYDFGSTFFRLQNGVYYQFIDNQTGAIPIMLDSPTVGDTWHDTTQADFHGMFHFFHTYEVIADNQQLVMPIGTFNDVIVVFRSVRGHQDAFDEVSYYKKGIGLLKREIEFLHYPSSIMWELDHFNIQ